MEAKMDDIINARLENIINVFSEEDKEFNRRMIDAGNQVSGVIRGNLHVDRLGGKVLRGSIDADHGEEDYDFTSKVLENY